MAGRQYGNHRGSPHDQKQHTLRPCGWSSAQGGSSAKKPYANHDSQPTYGEKNSGGGGKHEGQPYPSDTHNVTQPDSLTGAMAPSSPTEPPFKLLTVFFPMWNEEEYIHRALGAAREACETLVDSGEIADYELLIINDASTDTTALLANEAAANDRHVRVVHHPKNRKLGGSLKTGYSESRGDLILYSDADLPFDMDELQKACRVMRHYEADVVSAYRLDRTGEGYVRTVYSTIYNTMVRVLFDVRMRDVNFAFKLCRRRVLDAFELKSEGSFIDAELVVRAHKHGFRVVQFGVDYFPRTRGVSTLSSPTVIVKLLREMFGLRKELKSIRDTVDRASEVIQS